MSGLSRGNQKSFLNGFTGYDTQSPFAVHRLLRPHQEDRAPKQQGHCITVLEKPSRLAQRIQRGTESVLETRFKLGVSATGRAQFDPACQ